VTLTRCEGEEEGTETAAQCEAGEVRTKKVNVACSPVRCDLRKTIIGSTPKVQTRKVRRRVVGRMGMTSNFERERVDIPPAYDVIQKVVKAHTAREDCGRM